MKRTLSLILVLAMLASLFAALPLTAHAVPGQDGCTGRSSPDGRHRWVETGRQEGTCASPGMVNYVCRYCQKRVSETLTVAHKWGEWKIDTRGTCVNRALRVHTCSVCGTRAFSYGDYGDHKWGEWETVKEPTAMEPGEERRVCQYDAGHVETREIPAGGWKVLPASMTSPGLAIEVTWTEDAGEEKRVAGEAVPVSVKVTNTGNCPVFQISHSYAGEVSDLVLPHEEKQYIPQVMEYGSVVEPGESWTFILALKVKEADADAGVLSTTVTDWAIYQYDSDGTTMAQKISTDAFPVEIPLTIIGYQSVRVLNVDKETGEGLAGATFRIVDENGKDLKQWFSNGTPALIEKLEPNKTYTLRQIGTPAGYAPFPETEFVVGDDGVVTSACPVSGDGCLLVENEKGGGPHPALYLEVAWSEDMGVGKRIKGGLISLSCRITNTGDCPVYHLGTGGDPVHYSGSGNVHISDIVYPNGIEYVPELNALAAVILPGESWTCSCYSYVTDSEVETGTVDANISIGARWQKTRYDKGSVYTNSVPIHIPLTYPDGKEEEEEANPHIKLVYVEINYPGTCYDTDPLHMAGGYLVVRNNGNVPLRFALYGTDLGSTSLANAKFDKDILDPDESIGAYDKFPIVNTYGFLPPPPDEPDAAGVFTKSFMLYGYAVDDTERTTPICNDGPVTFVYTIYKHEPEIQEESHLAVNVEDTPMEAVLNQLNGFDSSDPAGYQLGEIWNAAITVENTGNVDVGSYTLHEEIEADDYTLGEDVSHGLIGAGETVDEYDNSPVGQITEKDVERGYVEVIASVKWTDPASGEERTVSSAVWNKPVISKTGLVLTKKAAPPPNGEYYLPGEEIVWSLKVTNNGSEPIRNVKVMDNGEVIATFG